MNIIRLSIIFFTLGAFSCTKEAKSTVDDNEKAKPAKNLTNETNQEKINRIENTESKIVWLTIEEAEALTKVKEKKIFIDVYADWCGPCKIMDKRTFKNNNVIKYANTHFYAVKFDAEAKEAYSFKGKTYENNGQYNTFVNYLGVNAFPTVCFFDEKAKPITKSLGLKGPKDFLAFLEFIENEEYKNQQQ